MELSERDRVMKLADFIHGVRVAHHGKDDDYNPYIAALRREGQ